MTIIQAFILGLIQGITEFLPISSSGHLIFLPKLFGWVDQGLAFDAFIHLGTLLAVIVYFRRKLLALIRSWIKKDEPDARANRRLGLFMLASMVPVGIVGLFADDFIEERLRTPLVIGLGFIVWGIVLFFADQYHKKRITSGKPQTEVNGMNAKQVAAVALAQAVALIPGTSRSGITMSAGLFAGLDKRSAAEFSFLMSIPIIGLAGGLKLLDLVQYGLGMIGMVPLLVGFTVSAVSGFLAIAGLLKIISRWSFTPFVVYRIIVGVMILLFLWK